MGMNSYIERFISHDYWWAALAFVGGVIGVIATIRRSIKEKDSKIQLFEKGFYLKSGGKELAYAYIDIQDLWVQTTIHYYNGIKS